MVAFPQIDTSIGQSGHAWLQPQWSAPGWTASIMTSRAGGVSQAPYDSMNLGDHVGDAPTAVAANRQYLQQACAMKPVFLQQVHGVSVVQLDAHTLHTQPPLQADGCFTSTPGLACTILVADCLPVLFTHQQARIVGAAHAGWRSLAGQQGHGVLEALLQAMRGVLPGHVPHEGWMAWLGPCIGPTAFEVGDEVRVAFVQANSAAERCFSAGARTGKWLADLPALARQRLHALGVEAVYGNDGSLPWCTWSQPDSFFSYRRSNNTGRMAASIWIKQ